MYLDTAVEQFRGMHPLPAEKKPLSALFSHKPAKESDLIEVNASVITYVLRSIGQSEKAIMMIQNAEETSVQQSQFIKVSLEANKDVIKSLLNGQKPSVSLP